MATKTKKLRFKNMYNMHLVENGEKKKFSPVSETIQGQTSSIQDMLVRYSNGESIPIDDRLQWLEEGDLQINIQDLTDFADVKAKLDDLSAKIAEAKEKVKQEQKVAENELKADSEANKEATTTVT